MQKKLFSTSSKKTGNRAPIIAAPKYVTEKIFISDNTNIELIKIPSGTFNLGSPRDEFARYDDEGPIEKVEISRPFWMSKYTITQKQWIDVFSQWPGSEPIEAYGKGDNHPAYYISWLDALEYCNLLSQLQGLQPAYILEDNGFRWEQENDGYRLPTEAEWEYAAKAKTRTPYYWGFEPNPLYAWMRDNSHDKTQPVGKKLPNAFGLHDMSGNVWEWCWNWYGPYSPTDLVDPLGPDSGLYCVFRGGSWFSGWPFCRTSLRLSFTPDYRWSLLGFRIVRTIMT